VSSTTSGGLATAAIQGGTSFATLPGYGGFQSPDIVGNLRVDQAWGSAQIMGALHEVNAAYYGDGSGTLENSGQPSTAWGFAVGGGIKLLAPMIGPADYFQAQVSYTQGALRYLFQAGDTNPYIQHGNSAAYGVLSDGVFGSVNPTRPSSIQLTTGWGVNAAYEHFWNKAWRTSVHGGYLSVSDNSLGNAFLCAAEGQASAIGSGSPVAFAGCNNNFQAWAIGTRTQWNVDASTYLGLDIAYTQIQSASSSTGLIPTAATNGTAQPVSPATTVCSTAVGCTVANEGVWSARFRVHRDFYP
jgi:hypothetical protein